jgi:hypothetical protein
MRLFNSLHEDVLFNISEHDKFTGHINQMNLWIKKIVIMGLLSCQHQAVRNVCSPVYQLLVHGRWFSPVSSTTNTGRHDIAEILLKVELNTINQIKSNPFGIALLIWIDYFSSNIDNKEKVQKDKQRSTKHTYKTKDRVTRTPLKKNRGELMCSGRVSSSCSLPVACPWSVVLSGYSGFFHH